MEAILWAILILFIAGIALRLIVWGFGVGVSFIRFVVRYRLALAVGAGGLCVGVWVDGFYGGVIVAASVVGASAMGGARAGRSDDDEG